MGLIFKIWKPSFSHNLGVTLSCRLKLKNYSSYNLTAVIITDFLISTYMITLQLMLLFTNAG